jgi:hypothetical protein
MNHESAERLPTLAHPLVFTPRKRVKNDGEGLRCPPFPEIDPTAEGCTFPHLHWIVINANQTRKRRLQRVRLAIEHEFCHRLLTFTPFSIFTKHQVLHIFCLILRAFDEKQEQIPVPLSHHLSRNKLEEQWAYIVALTEQSSLVEEVFAVRSSLIEARKRGLIQLWQLGGITDIYKKEYGEDIDGFEKTYEAFDLIAKKIGKTAIVAMIYSVLGTLHPDEAFLEIISEWNLSDKQTKALSKLSFEEAQDYFNNIIDDLDPDGSFYRKTDFLDSVEKIEEDYRVKAKDIELDFIKFLAGTPNTYIISKYSKNIHPFLKLGGFTQEVEYGNFILVIRSYSAAANPRERVTLPVLVVLARLLL